MKITFKTAAQSLLLLAACLAAVAQSEITPDHFPDQASPVAFAPARKPRPSLCKLGWRTMKTCCARKRNR